MAMKEPSHRESRKLLLCFHEQRLKDPCKIRIRIISRICVAGFSWAKYHFMSKKSKRKSLTETSTTDQLITKFSKWSNEFLHVVLSTPCGATPFEPATSKIRSREQLELLELYKQQKWLEDEISRYDSIETDALEIEQQDVESEEAISKKEEELQSKILDLQETLHSISSKTVTDELLIDRYYFLLVLVLISI